MAGVFPHIAVCVAGGPENERVLAQTVELREAIGAETVSVVHVADIPPVALADPSLLGGAGFATASSYDPEPFLEGSRKALEELAQAIPGANGVLLEGGHPASAVCEWAAESGCDLLVAGSHRGLWDRVTLGSFASHLAHHAPCSVLLVRPAS